MRFTTNGLIWWLVAKLSNLQMYKTRSINMVQPFWMVTQVWVYRPLKYCVSNVPLLTEFWGSLLNWAIYKWTKRGH